MKAPASRHGIVCSFQVGLLAGLLAGAVPGAEPGPPTGAFELLGAPVHLGRLHATRVGPDAQGRPRAVYLAFAQGTAGPLSGAGMVWAMLEAADGRLYAATSGLRHPRWPATPVAGPG